MPSTMGGIVGKVVKGVVLLLCQAPLACLLQPQCPWSCSLCESLNSIITLTQIDAGTIEMRPTSLEQWLVQMGETQKEQYWSCAKLPLACLLQTQCPWSCSVCESLKVNPKANPNLT